MHKAKGVQSMTTSQLMSATWTILCLGLSEMAQHPYLSLTNTIVSEIHMRLPMSKLILNCYWRHVTILWHISATSVVDKDTSSTHCVELLISAYLTHYIIDNGGQQLDGLIPWDFGSLPTLVSMHLAAILSGFLKVTWQWVVSAHLEYVNYFQQVIQWVLLQQWLIHSSEGLSAMLLGVLCQHKYLAHGVAIKQGQYFQQFRTFFVIAVQKNFAPLKTLTDPLPNFWFHIALRNGAACLPI
jgi:hypothetical protein